MQLLHTATLATDRNPAPIRKQAQPLLQTPTPRPKPKPHHTPKVWSWSIGAEFVMVLALGLFASHVASIASYRH